MGGTPWKSQSGAPEPVATPVVGPPARCPQVDEASGLAESPGKADPSVGSESPSGSGDSQDKATDNRGAEASALPTTVGPYSVEAKIGTGGMATVYKAVQPSLRRPVAIKELRGHFNQDPRVAARFEREAMSMATLQHTNIVHIYDYLKQDHCAHIVMEYVEGVDLFTLLKKAGRIPMEVAVFVGLQIVEGLEYAHERTLVHRDVKPSNILVSKRGLVKLMDFGIARDPGRSELTEVGVTLGTPPYMAPEQIRGAEIDARTDQFAFGIVLFEMLTGQRPWRESQERSVTVALLDEPPPDIRTRMPGIPNALAVLIETCLEKDPDDRHPSTRHLRRALQNFAHRVLAVDAKAKMLDFLREHGVLKEAEVTAFMGSTTSAEALEPSEGLMAHNPERFRVAKSVLGLFVVGAMVSLAFVTGLWLKEAPKAPVQAVAEEVPRGRIRVVVDPWARVYVDGQLHDTTPFAKPIPLLPGEHTIGFRNPYYHSVDRIVDIHSGEQRDLKIRLKPRKESGSW